jgi:lipopolysaccharide export LptBFGC system permease protein LptF
VVVQLKAQSDLSSAAILKLNSGSIHRSELERNYYEKIDFNEYRLMLKVEEGRTDEVKYAKTLDADELRSQMKKFKGDYSRYQEYAIEFWKRIALALTPLCFGVLGVGLGIVRMRSVKSNAVFVAAAVVIIYWALHISGASLAEKGLLPPFLAMQLPNLAVLPFAVLSFKKSSW